MLLMLLKLKINNIVRILKTSHLKSRNYLTKKAA